MLFGVNFMYLFRTRQIASSWEEWSSRKWTAWMMQGPEVYYKIPVVQEGVQLGIMVSNDGLTEPAMEHRNLQTWRHQCFQKILSCQIVPHQANMDMPGWNQPPSRSTPQSFAARRKEQLHLLLGP